MQPILQQMSFPKYRELPGLNSHTAYNYLKSPRKTHHETKEEPSPAQRLGTLVHALLADESVRTIPKDAEPATKKGKAAFVSWAHEILQIDIPIPTRWDELCQHAQLCRGTLRGEGILAATAEERQEAAEICAGILKHPLAGELLTGALFERTIQAEYQGLMLKGRLDAVQPDLEAFYDLKVLRDIAPNAVRRSAYAYGYFFQMSFYQRLWEASPAPLIPDPFIIAAESTPPYDVRVFDIADERLAEAHEQVSEALDTYRRCIEAQFWPGPGWIWTQARYGIETL